MPIRTSSLSATLMGFTRADDGINKEGEILSRLAANIHYMRIRLPDQPLNKTVQEMKAAGIRITVSWLSDLESDTPVDITLTRLIGICNFYQVTLSEILFEDLSSKYLQRS